MLWPFSHMVLNCQGGGFQGCLHFSPIGYWRVSSRLAGHHRWFPYRWSRRTKVFFLKEHNPWSYFKVFLDICLLTIFCHILISPKMLISVSQQFLNEYQRELNFSFGYSIIKNFRRLPYPIKLEMSPWIIQGKYFRVK